jgi:3',5'-cyclic AMP phosphodiesterase CpdA
VILAQISDLHIGLPGVKLSGVVDTADYLRKAVRQIGRLAPTPDALLITGDLVDHGHAEEYRRLRELLSPLAMPVYVIPGNHDDRDALRRAFSDHGYLPHAGFLHYVIDTLPVIIIALDTVVPREAGGALDEARLLWLAARLHETQGRPTVIMMHHPPFDTGIGFMDSCGLLVGAAEFARLMAGNANVERILCGHVHRAIEARIGTSIAMTCPSTCHQIPLDLTDNGPEAFTLEPPGFRLHRWDGARIVTHTAAIGDFPGPYPF